MKKWIFAFSLMFTMTLASAPREYMLEHDHEVAPKAFTEQDGEYLSPDAVSANYLSVKGMSIEGFSGESLKKIQKAFEVLEKVMNSEEFKNAVINFKNSKGQRAFASNNRLSNEEIYEKLMES